MTTSLTGYAISPQQRRLWTLAREGRRLLVQRAAWLDADAADAAGAAEDPEALRRAVLRAFGAHEAVRTALVRPPGSRLPLQVVGDEPAVAWRVAERGGASAAPAAEAAEVALDALCAEELLGDFDPEAGPAVRVALLPAGVGGPGRPGRPALVVTASALVVDGRSLEVLLEDLAGHLADPTGALAEVAVQHAQFSEWQNEVAGEAGPADEEDGALEDGVGRAALPFLRPTEGRRGDRPVLVRHLLAPATSRRLRAAAGGDPEELASLLLAVWAVLLRSLTRSDRLEIGASVAVRPVEDLARVVGPLAKVVPVALGLRGDFRLSEVRDRSRAALAEAAGRQEASFRPPLRPGEGSGAPRPAFVFGADLGHSGPGGLAASGIALARTYDWTEPCDLGLRAGLRGEAVELVHYGCAEGVAPDDLERLARRFGALLEAACEAPEATVEELERHLGPGEEEELLGFAGRPAPDAPPVSFLDSFRAAVARGPSVAAVVAEDGSLDYEALDARSDAVARALAEAGAGPETLVGLWADRSTAAIAGLLGILKAGGAFVPLDPALPANRLARLADELDLELLVGDGDLPEPLVHGGSRERRVVSPASGPEAVAPPRADAPPRAGSEEQTAYLLFTSGSTGRPKGVVVARRHLASYVREVVERLGLEPGERFASVSTLAADLGNTMVFPALATGGTLVLFSAEEIGDPRAFARAVAEHRVDNLKIVPTHLAALLQEGEAAAILPGKRLVLGGERAEAALVDRVLEAAPCAVYNHYGPTETTVGVAVADAGRWRAEPRSATVPLGRPLPESRLHVVDAALRPLPVWTAGEIAVGGAHVTRGYHGRPAATARAFVPDPFSGVRGARLYRTGDLGRLLGDGSVEFLGRRDRQLKIRGFRVETGEIEATLRRHVGVSAAVVVPREAREGEPGGLRLVAYVVPRGDGEGAGEPRDRDQGRGRSLQDFVHAELPAYMVPQVIQEVGALPLGPNGKVDLAALPDPEAPGRAARRPYEAPRDAVEELVVELWRDLLGTERIGVRDDFFELGGHSLLAMQLLSRLRRTFAVEVPLAAVFDRTSVGELAAALGEHEPSPGHLEKVARVHLKVRSMSGDEVAAELSARAGAREGAGG